MLYELFRWIAMIQGFIPYWLFFKRKTYYEDPNMKRRPFGGARINGGALIISNHFSVVDYMVYLFLFGPRKLYVVTSEIAYKSKFVGWGMKSFGGIKVDRTVHNMRFIDDSADEINRGHQVLIFPESRNTEDGEMHEFMPSYLGIALQTESPIVPVITDGNYGFFKQTHVMVGKPIDWREYVQTDDPSKEEIAELNDIIYRKALELQAELRSRIAKK